VGAEVIRRTGVLVVERDRWLLGKDPGRLLSGVATDTSANDLANICVYLYPVGGSAPTAARCTLANGSYVISGATTGSYDVAFADLSGDHTTQLYNGAATPAGATAVTVPNGGGTVSGIDVAMAFSS
jgi:hypothetical protein